MKKTQLALVLVGIAALALGGTALAAKSHTNTKRAASAARADVHHGPGDDLAAAASYLGSTTDALLTQLQAGKTLAQIANATSGKSASGLIDALVADATTRFGGNAPADLRQRITEMVNGTMPPMGMGHRDGGPGHWGGPPPGGPRERRS
jgi:hypothetical protein